jgi:hypothetical protein
MFQHGCISRGMPTHNHEIRLLKDLTWPLLALGIACTLCEVSRWINSARMINWRNLLSHFVTPYMQDEKRVENLRQLCESDLEREVYDISLRKDIECFPK